MITKLVGKSGSLLLLAALVGCGGGATPAQSAKALGPDGGVLEPGETAPGAAAGDVGSSGLTGDAREAYERGFKAWEEGDLQGAKKAFQEAGQKDTKSPSPHYSLGVVMERLGETTNAQQEFRAAIGLKLDHEPAMCALSLSLAGAGKAAEADSMLTEKREKFPRSPRIAACAAEIKSIMGDHATAQQLGQEALRLDPDFKEAMVTIARDHYRSRKMDLAKYALQAILDGFGEGSPPRDKENGEAHLIRGLILREASQRAAAMKDFEEAVAKRKDLVEALIQLGSMRLEAGNAQEAQPLLESAVKFAPMNPIAHVNLGDCYRLLSRPADAKREFDIALQQDSTLALAHYDQGLLYLFSPSIPGMSPTDQVATAISELETYRKMRGERPLPGVNDDIDDLLSRGKAKQAELKLGAGAAAGGEPPAAAAAPAAPAAGGDGGT